MESLKPEETTQEDKDALREVENGEKPLTLDEVEKRLGL